LLSLFVADVVRRRVAAIGSAPQGQRRGRACSDFDAACRAAGIYKDTADWCLQSVSLGLLFILRVDDGGVAYALAQENGSTNRDAVVAAAVEGFVCDDFLGIGGEVCLAGYPNRGIALGWYVSAFQGRLFERQETPPENPVAHWLCSFIIKSLIGSYK